MKTIFKFSMAMNLLLLGCLAYAVVRWQRTEIVQLPPAVESKPTPQAVVTATASEPSKTPPQSFSWSQLDSGSDYRAYIANLRSIGCPESTIEDIVAGNVDRAFAWKRAQLKIDDSGTGPWSKISEEALVANLMGRQFPVAAVSVQDANGPAAANQTDEAAASSSDATTYPLFMAQNVDWGQMGFDAGEQAAIAHARQQFLNDVNGPQPGSGGQAGQNNDTASPNANPNDPGYIQRWQTALQNANDSLQTELGNQDFATYEMQQYYEWYKPQVLANKDGGTLHLNLPDYVPH